MNRDILNDALGEIRDDFILDANKKPPKKKLYYAIGTLAACVCIAAAVALPKLVHTTTTEPTYDVTCDEAFGIIINGNENLAYYPISFEDRIRFNLVPEGAMGLTPENTYKITEQDLGEVMGTVSQCGDEAIVGKTVYHFASYPDSSAICILDSGGTYEFYCADGYFIDDAQSSDILFSTYNLPDKSKSITVQDTEGQTLFEITDADTMAKLCTLLSGCENIGHEAAEKRFAQAWFDEYGNNDVYYNEADGCCAYRNTVEPEERTYTDDEGNEITETYYPDDYFDIYDNAHKLWSTNERSLIIENSDGFRLNIDYFPSIGVFFSQDGQFAVSEEKAVELKEMLRI